MVVRLGTSKCNSVINEGWINYKEQCKCKKRN
jgi:hypothetical protein